MSILSVCAVAVIASVLAVFLKKQNAEVSVILGICAVAVISIYVLLNITSVIADIKSIFAGTDLDSKYIVLLLKCVGICFLTEFSCNCCKDASQSALSSVVMMCGRVCVLITSLPLFEEFLDITVKLSGGNV